MAHSFVAAATVDEQPRQLYREPRNVCRWLGEQAEALGVEIYPGFAAAEISLPTMARCAASRRRHGRRARRQRTAPTTSRGWSSTRKYTLFAEGCRGSLSQELMTRFDLRRDVTRRNTGSASRSCGRSSPRSTARAGAAHAGLAARYAHRRRLVRLPLRRQPRRRGFVVHLNYAILTCRRTTNSSASRRTRRSGARSTAASGSPTARARSTKADCNRCRRSRFPGGALIGCAAGFVNPPRIKGSHNAMKTGMLLAASSSTHWRRVARTTRSTTIRSASAHRGCTTISTRSQRPARAEVGDVARHAARRREDVATTLSSARCAWTLRHGAGSPGAESRVVDAADRLPKYDGVLTLRQAVVRVFVEHQSCRGSARAPGLRDASIPVNGAARLRWPRAALLPCRRLRIRRRGGCRGKRLQADAQTAATARPATSRTRANIHWVTPGGGGGPNYVDM